MGDPFMAAKMEIEMFKYSDKKAFAEWAEGKWTHFSRKEPSDGGGVPQKCYYNAFTMARADPNYKFYVGYALDAELPIALQHAWVVDDGGAVHDCTPRWSQKASVSYYGVHVPLMLAEMIFDYDTKHGQPPSTNDFFADISWALTQQGAQVDTGFLDFCVQ